MSFVGDFVNKITGADEAAQAQRDAATSAANATVESTEKNIEFQKWLWGEQKALQQPFVTSGEKALAQYQNLLNGSASLADMPGAQFAMEQGIKAYDASGSARGTQLSGKQAKDLTRFGENTAYGFYQRELDNLYRQITLGQASAAGQAQAGTFMGSQVGQAFGTQGQALSNMYQQIGMANASESMAGWNTLMDVGSLAVGGYGAYQLGK